MFNKIKKFFEFSSKTGLFFPAAYDSISKGPSSSLLFSHLAFYLAFIMTICLGIKDISQGVIASTVLAAMYLVFYLLRRLTKVSFDLDDRSFELDSSEEQQTKKEEKSE